MTLTLNLGTEVQGDKLAEIVQASMKEIDDWQFETKKNTSPTDFNAAISYSQEILIVGNIIPHLIPERAIHFISYSSLENTKGNVAYSLRKKEGKKESSFGNVVAFGFYTTVLTFATFGFFTCLIKDCYYQHLWMPRFAHDDSIFTFINPEREYNQLEFYANAAFNFENPLSGGVVQQDESPQFRKIQPTYDRLIEGIKSKLPRQSPYRTKGLVL